MDNCYIFTNGGFKQLDAVVDNPSQKVFVVNNQLQCYQTTVDHWEYNQSSMNYCIANNDHQFKMWFGNDHKLLVIQQREVIEITGRQYYNDYQNNIWNFPTRFELAANTREAINVYQLQQMAKNQILSTELITSSRQKISQLLYEWQRSYGGYYARNYKQLMMLQSVVTANGYCSHVVRDNGFKIIPYQLTTMTIDRISSTASNRFEFIPFDKNNKQLHLIYNVENYTFVL